MSMPLSKFHTKDHQEICNLDCKKPKKKEEKKPEYPQVHDFNGPVKLVLLDPPDERDLNQRKTAASLISMANIAIGANFCIYFLYSLSFVLNSGANFHLALSSTGCQFLLPLAILIHHPLFGAAGPLTDSQRTWNHVKLVLVAMAFIIGGTYLGGTLPSKHKPQYTKYITWLDQAWNTVENFFAYHFYFGCGVGVFFGISIVNGSLLLIFKENPRLISLLTIFHRYTGLLTLTLGGVCFILSLASPAMQVVMYMSAYLVPTFVMTFLTVFYTAVMVILPGSSFKEHC